MSYSEGLTGAPPIIEVPLELLEEVLWLFRVEDGKRRGWVVGVHSPG